MRNISLLAAFFAVLHASAVQFDVAVFDRLVASSGDKIVVTAYDSNSRKTWSFAMPMNRYEALPACSHDEMPPDSEISPAMAAAVAREELIRCYPEAADITVDAVSLSRCELPFHGGHMWMYAVDFRMGEWFFRSRGAKQDDYKFMGLRFLVLLDGKPLRPSVTPYTEYLDACRHDNAPPLISRGVWRAFAVFILGSTCAFAVVVVICRRRRVPCACSGREKSSFQDNHDGCP